MCSVQKFDDKKTLEREYFKNALLPLYRLDVAAFRSNHSSPFKGPISGGCLFRPSTAVRRLLLFLLVFCLLFLCGFLLCFCCTLCSLPSYLRCVFLSGRRPASGGLLVSPLVFSSLYLRNFLLCFVVFSVLCRYPLFFVVASLLTFLKAECFPVVLLLIISALSVSHLE